ncbi:hypothetical protein ABTY96_28100 [Streptomyces sp. NPDC096057]|uniref:hypothetical protein n=1 Tax=Streptomyces sp. NPDC096057 TaxID=3155543 RepID=UPI00332545F9
MSEALIELGDTSESSNRHAIVENAIDEYFPPSIRRILKERIQRRFAEQSSSDRALGLAIHKMAGRSHEV